MRLDFTMVLLATLALLAQLLSPSGWALAADSDLGLQPGTEFQMCTCLGTMEDAQTQVAKVKEIIGGLQARIQPREIDARVVYEIWVRHPAMSPRSICNALGRASCSSAQGGCGRKGGGDQ